MESRTQDITRQTVIIASASFMLIAAAVGSGAFGGTSVSELQDGALSAQGSYLAPAGPAFSIWSLIYIGLIAYTVWQALPAQRADERQRAVGGWIAASMVLNGLWLVTAQFLSLPLTVLMIAAAARDPRPGDRDPRTLAARATWPERIVVDGANGLHFGWVTIATVANITAWLTQIAPESWAAQAEVWAVVVLAVVLVIGVAAAWSTGRIAPALATAWGLGLARRRSPDRRAREHRHRGRRDHRRRGAGRRGCVRGAAAPSGRSPSEPDSRAQSQLARLEPQLAPSSVCELRSGARCQVLWGGRADLAALSLTGLNCDMRCQLHRGRGMARGSGPARAPGVRAPAGSPSPTR